MKTMKNAFLLLALSGVALISSCKKDKHDHDPEPGTVKVKVDHKWGMSGASFALNTELVHPMNNDTMTFTTFKYYVSNFKLKKSDGTWWSHPESYFLVDLSNTASLTMNLTNVPAGDYTDMQYTLGVDSTRNVSGAQTGALSTSNGMFWSWNTGYIMVKAEGTSPQSGTGNFAFHLGGFQGTNKIVTTKTVNFGAVLKVEKSNNTQVHLIANPAKLFHADPLSSGTNVMMPGAKAKSMADNFYGGFSFDKIVQ
jgi:hypothetical protein